MAAMEDTTQTQRPGFHLTPDRLVLLLLVVECLLWLSDRLGWPAWHKGYAVLAAVAAVGVAMMTMLVWFALALLLRRRFQFGIGSLLLLVVVVAIPCSWTTLAMRKARQQATAVAAIVKTRGNRVLYDSWSSHSEKLGSNFGWDFEGTGRQPQWLAGLVGEDFVSDVVAVWFRPNTTDSDWECLGWLPAIRFLELHGNRLPDKALEHVQGLTSLNVLDLSGTPVTDAGLEHLKGLTALRKLDLSRTNVTFEGVWKLQKALPNCEIHHSLPYR